jgi:F-type H+-transporting ATPase subunit delta
MPSGSAGRRYANAIFDLARSQNKVDDWARDLEALALTFDKDEVRRFLENPKTSRDKKRAFIQNVLSNQVSKDALNLAQLLVQRERETYIDAIQSEYTRLYNQYKGIEVAKVTTAVPVDDQEKEQIRRRLMTLTGKTQVQIETQVDPEIIGGIIAQVGDTLIDGSVRSRLQALKKQLA